MQRSFFTYLSKFVKVPLQLANVLTATFLNIGNKNAACYVQEEFFTLQEKYVKSLHNSLFSFLQPADGFCFYCHSLGSDQDLNRPINLSMSRRIQNAIKCYRAIHSF